MSLLIAGIVLPFLGWVIAFVAMLQGGYGNIRVSEWSREDLKETSFKVMLFGFAIAGIGLAIMLGCIIAIIFGWRPEPY